jgi:hypothetical protein
MVADKLLQRCCTRSAASEAQGASRHVTAGARLSLRVTRRWRSAESVPCLPVHRAGSQVDGGRQATSALLHTIRRQHSAERCPPHGGRRKAVTVRVTRHWRSAERAPLLHRAERRADGGRQATTALLHTIRRQRSARCDLHMAAGARLSLRVTRRSRSAERTPS